MKFLAIGIFAVAASSLAQAGIKGSVLDESGAPIQNAVITTRTLPSLLSMSGCIVPKDEEENGDASLNGENDANDENNNENQE